MKITNQGIWYFAKMLPEISKPFRLTLGEGKTAFSEKSGLYFKCEFLNPTGSIKDRGLCFQISKLAEKKVRHAVISSSGNAALAASAYCRLAGIKLIVFVSPNINTAKLAALKENSDVYIDSRPVSSAHQYALKNNFYNLRQSTDPNAAYGFETVSFEIDEEIGRIDDLFLAVSSGTALKGMADGFKESGYLPRFHAVQTAKIYPLAGQFDTDFIRENTSLADAIVARTLPREGELLKIIRKSGGFGWVIPNNDMQNARSALLKMGLDSSFEGAAAYAAVEKAKSKGFSLGKTVVILTGKYYPDE
ncbi:hypothetical protein A3D78_02635 [Candidatus Gottesmanbacteria bacterium RIFCSPHIGHO2_02_FULL_39_14]|uniref:Tryptophan synthase beta chain-like PALP domain-containing protein n=1 Tax=Candidatus Gottesmanbacteria bacterium RIFCSPHIGHO2_02_FULL_39_14 TaxID=1798383 RepID=A0A1F6A3K7_9BACT|nr:MAG: hypothetical protein A3D78_02635 [Candidatus Gottesmanbacteria bacterium RIFCSPHIGHO2_02_FULL_39_14]